MSVCKSLLLPILLVLAVEVRLSGVDSPPMQGDAKWQAAIAAFTQKMKEANYPALFQKAAQEFNVPVDILEGLSFAETRWDHLTWAPGDIASPETGMPRPYGIMSLWDNPYFGHSLLEAAALVGKTPDDLKQDVFQNMRGGAALLRKLYDETPKPDGTTEADLESWRYAIRKYCGIPEPELNAQHALEVYIWISRGYHQYGIEWNGRPVNIEPIREEARRLLAEEQAKRAARLAAHSPPVTVALPSNSVAAVLLETNAEAAGSDVPAAAPPLPVLPANPAPAPDRRWWYFGLAVVVLALILWCVQYFRRTQHKEP